jgi:hypothetical protein
LEKHKKVEERTKIYIPYNILPLDPASADQTIMQYSEVLLLAFLLCYPEINILKLIFELLISFENFRLEQL